MPGPENADCTHQSLRDNTGTSNHNIPRESSETSNNDGENGGTKTQHHTSEDTAESHESRDERLSVNAAAIPSTLPGMTPVDGYYGHGQALEGQDITESASDHIEPVENSIPAKDISGTHLGRNFGHTGDGTRQRSLTPGRGSRQADASSNEFSDKIQPLTHVEGSVDLGVQLDGTLKTITCQGIPMLTRVNRV
jgi:hypothetical protein